MPLILHIETATKVCSVALSRAEEVLSVRESRESYRHAEQLGLFIRQVTEEAGVAIPGLSAVAVSIGPGSYTGLRIGLSTAKGLCYGAGLKLIALPTLRCLANGIRKKMSATATDGL
ncbi:MAG: tRNA (adenosine(37)-N6)-threonylcarbamoyltransferase complex dimerization subunit type 1 TsaB, partial [Flavobacteriales bacterium]